MSENDLSKLIAGMNVVQLEKLLHIIDVECRDRHYTEHPDECMYTAKELKKMRSYSKLTH